MPWQSPGTFRRSLALMAILAMSSPGVNAVAATPDFERDIRPILAKHCFECHGDKAKKGNLALGSTSDMLHGGQSGAAIVAGAADQSLLVDMIADGSMPPDGRPPLAAAEVTLLRSWVDSLIAADLDDIAGTTRISDDDRNYWAFRKSQSPPIPAVRHLEQVRTPIDAFVLKKLEAQGLS